MTQPIPEQLIRKQAWKFYFVVIAWPLYIFILPSVYDKSKILALLFIIFPGVYLFTWLACLMHECWHKYVPNIPNNFFYYLFSYMLITDPQIYKLIHGYHHSKVNTWDDTEFHPLGEIKNPILRRIYNLLEITLGVIFIFGLHMQVIQRHPRYKDRFKRSANTIAIIMWVIIYGGLGSLSARLFNLSTSQIVIPILISFLACSLFIHHLQMIEHGNLIIEGDLQKRNVGSRNLKNDRFGEKLFNFLTHGDSREHTLHHTAVSVYSRPFPGKVPMPPESVYISLTDYAVILCKMITKG